LEMSIVTSGALCIFNKLNTVLEILEDLIDTSSDFVAGIGCVVNMIGSMNVGAARLNCDANVGELFNV